MGRSVVHPRTSLSIVAANSGRPAVSFCGAGAGRLPPHPPSLLHCRTASARAYRAQDAARLSRPPSARRKSAPRQPVRLADRLASLQAPSEPCARRRRALRLPIVVPLEQRCKLSFLRTAFPQTSVQDPNSVRMASGQHPVTDLTPSGQHPVPDRRRSVPHRATGDHQRSNVTIIWKVTKKVQGRVVITKVLQPRASRSRVA